MRIRPASRLRGRVCVPGDKSISHRAAIIAALARGRTEITNFSTSADCASTLEVIGALGVPVERDGATVRVEGAGMDEGPPRFRRPSQPLDCGNSGTTMRLVAGVLAAQPFDSVLTGDDSLNRRPMLRIVQPLGFMGARVSTVEGHAPLRVEGRWPLEAISYEMPVASAQVKSCVLLAGLGADGHTQVVEPNGQTRNHTERMLAWFGAEVETKALTRMGVRHPWDFRVSVMLKGPARLRARDVSVPGDFSSAAFLVAAAAMLRGSVLELDGVGLNPTRTHLLRLLKGLGAYLKVDFASVEEEGEPVGSIRVRGARELVPDPEYFPSVAGWGPNGETGSNVVRGHAVAKMIDELPVLAVLATQVRGGLEIRDARELRVKESDRIRAVAANLHAMGARVHVFDDGLRVEGPTRLRGARLQSFGDHRIAMAFAVAALAAEGESEIVGAEECVPVSFPEFFPVLESLAER